MGDISTEPSMEEILSSIKRIIAEEGDGAAAATRSRRVAKSAPAAGEEVLELSDTVGEEAAEPAPAKAAAPAAPAPARAAPVDPILSERVVEATRAPLEALSRMVVKPEVPASDTLEGLVREMLKPMLREWLDANLPEIVERTVAREISRITGRHG